MKKSLLALVGFAALSAVAFAQNTGTTTTSANCTGEIGTDLCEVQGQTLLQAVKVEGITLTVPNEIDFTLVDGQLNPGNQPLTATTTWDLSSVTGAANIAVTAWFASSDAMSPTDGSGDTNAPIQASAIIGQIGNNGPQLAFGAGTPYVGSSVSSAFSLPLYEVPPTSNSTAPGVGSFTENMNLFVDSIHNQYAPLAPGAVYAGVVYITAEVL